MHASLTCILRNVFFFFFFPRAACSVWRLSASGCAELLACMHAMKYSGEGKALRSWKTLLCSSTLPAGARSYAAESFGSDSLSVLADILQAGGKKKDTHTFTIIEVEMKDKEQGGGGGVATESCCPQAQEHFLHYTSVSLPCFFPLFLPQVTAGDIKGIGSPLTSTSLQLTRSVSS